MNTDRVLLAYKNGQFAADACKLLSHTCPDVSARLVVVIACLVADWTRSSALLDGCRQLVAQRPSAA